MDLLEIIEQEPEASAALFDIILQKGVIKQFSKGDIILREGAYCRHLYFIHQGSLRLFYIDEEGNENTQWLCFDRAFMTEINSFFKEAPSEFYIHAMEDCELIMLSKKVLEQISEEQPSFHKLEKMVYRAYLLELGDKIMDLQFRDATTRYENLLAKQSDILQRIPLGYIASYLGITQQSLSRIRRQFQS